MKTTIACGAVFFAVIGATRADAERRVLAAPDFPESYQERYSDEGTIPTEFGDARYEDMIARQGSATLVLRRFEVPRESWEHKTSDAMFNDAREMMLSGSDGLKLVSERDFTIDDFPGRSFVFEEPDGSMRRMDYFLLKPDLFIYSCFGLPEDLDRPEVQVFFASIKTMVDNEEDGQPGATDNPDDAQRL